MTIALTLKVQDGIVLAADSASTLLGAAPQSVVNVYNNANKIFNLRKGLPIGLVTWGLGGIGGVSISTLAKDLRRRFTGLEPDHMGWKLDEDNYTISDVADHVREFMYDEKYAPANQISQQGGSPLPGLGFFVVGHSPGADHSEEYELNIAPGGCSGPALLRQPDETGVSWAGQPEAISRLLSGHGLDLPTVLEQDLGVDSADLPTKMDIISGKLAAPMVNSAMPIQDAIDLAEFLVDISIKFSRFMPGSPTVGGPIESAAVSKHEGFKWIKRKHYFDRDLNPEASS